MGDSAFYLLNDTSVVGNCAVWWRAEGEGYTTDLRDAGRYPFDRATSIQRNSRGDVRAIACGDAEALVRHHVDWARARQLSIALVEEVPLAANPEREGDRG